MPSSSAHWRHRQDQVGLGGGLGQEEVADHQEVQAAQAGDDGVGVRGGDRDVGGVHEEAADAVGLSEGLQQFDGGEAGAGDERLGNAPDVATWARAAGSVILR